MRAPVSELYSIVLPWPPALSAYYANATRRTKGGKTWTSKMITQAGIDFRNEVLRRVRAGHRPAPRIVGRVTLSIYAVPPSHKRSGAVNNNRRDLDNILKATLDALVACNVLLDDSQIDELRVRRGNSEREPHLLVAIDRFDVTCGFFAPRPARIVDEMTSGGTA